MIRDSQNKNCHRQFNCMGRLRILVFLISLLIGVITQAQTARRSSRGGEASSARASSSSGTLGSKGYMFETQFYYGAGSAQADPSTVTGEPTLTNEFESNSGLYSLKLGRVYASGFYLGALYSVRSDVRGTVTMSGRSQALGLGYFGDSGGSIRFYYHLGETYGDFSNGHGGSTDLGYYLKLGSNIYVGFLLTYQQIQYLKNPLVANFKNWTASWSHPAITIAYSTR